MLIKRKTLREDTKSSDIVGDKEMFKKISVDMLRNAGKLHPEPNWDLNNAGKDGGEYFKNAVLDGNAMESTQYEFDEEHYEEHYSTLHKMMDPWVGCTGEQQVNSATVKQYIDALEGIDYMNLFKTHFNSAGDLLNPDSTLMITDLGSIMDVNLISSLLLEKEKIVILELGGGYGRLAEVFMHIFGPEQVKYVMIDTVPASLMYSAQYLQDRFPEIKVGSYYKNDQFDLERHPIYVMPSWKFRELNNLQYDVSINIQSMQEIGQYHVDYYLNLFDDVTKNDGIVYLSNEKDYIFRGEWNYPDHWRCILKHRTPRSWTRNSPTGVFIKSDGNYTQQNRLLQFMYDGQLKSYDLQTALSEEVNRLTQAAKEQSDQV